jgi:DNA-binding GntR family transcriptional regulator
MKKMASAKDTAYEQLRLRLLTGRYEPGMHLKEEPLARELGLSRTPIRAALRRLVNDGLATDEAGQGIRVADWTSDDIDEIFQLRILLEPFAARRAVQRAGAELAPRLRALNLDMAEGIAQGGAEGMVRVQAANQTFHRTLLDASGPSRTRTILVSLMINPVVIRGFYLYSAEELAQSLHHHQDLALAAEAGDSELARDVMQLHIRMAYKRFSNRRLGLLNGQHV